MRALGDLVDASLAESGPVRPVEASGLPGGCGISVSLPLGQPPVGVLQLLTTEKVGTVTVAEDASEPR